MGRNFRDLLFADVALELGVADVVTVATALQEVWEGGAGGRDIAERLGIEGGARARVEDRVAVLLAAADGDPGVAVARRGGIDRSIHASLRPATSVALVREGAGARAPLRPLPSERYAEFQLIGKGGMGVVYLALDTELNRRVAFKMVRPDPEKPQDAPAPTTPLHATPPSGEETDSQRSFEELRLRFLQEAWVTGAMEHPGITPVYELGETAAGIPYYTMRYVKGERTLAAAIREAADLDARLALLDPFLKVCDTLRYAHARGVFHRDLKPENIALGEFGEAVVLDWGLSKMAGRPDVSSSLWRARIEDFRQSADLQSVAGAKGTAGYMAPEAALGKSEEVDARSDVYSLGAILFETLTGRLPFRFRTFVEYVEKLLTEAPPPARDVAPGVPAELSDACARALSRGREERFASVDELASSVRRWLQEGPIERQVAELVRDAEGQLEAAGRLSGNAMLWHLDRASAACSKVLHLRPGHGRVRELLDAIKRMREGGIRARVATARRKAVFIGGFAVLALATFVALRTAKALSDERERAEHRIEEVRVEVARAQLDTRVAREGEREARTRLADAYAGIAGAHLERGWVAGARAAAAMGVLVQPTARTWKALAEAEARWAPTLRAVVAADAVDLRFAGHQLLLAVGDEVRVYDPARKQFGPALRHEAPVLHVAADGAVVAGAAANGRVRLWDLASGEALGQFPEAFAVRGPDQDGILEGTRPLALELARGGDAVFAAYGDPSVRCWIRAAGSSAAIRLEDGGMLVPSLRRSGGYVWGSDIEGRVFRWDAGAPWKCDETGTSGAEQAIVVGTADGTAAHICTPDHRIFLLELDTWPSEMTVFEGPPERAAAFAVSGDVACLGSASHDGVLSVWDVQARALRATVPGHGHVRALALSDDGAMLAAASADGTVRIWDLTGGWAPAGVPACSTVARSPDGSKEYIGRLDGSVDIWDAAAGNLLRRLPGGPLPAVALAPGADGAVLFGASLEGTVRVWDPEEGAELHAFTIAGAHPTALLAVPGTGEVFVGLLDGSVQRWNWRAGRRAGQLSPPAGEAAPIAAMALASDPPRLLVRRADDTTGAWSLDTLEVVEAEFPHTPRPLPSRPAPVSGPRSPWIDCNPAMRLVEIENRYAVYLDGFAARPVPKDMYDPLAPRLDPWSR